LNVRRPFLKTNAIHEQTWLDFRWLSESTAKAENQMLTELKATARSKLRNGQRRQSIITACCKQAELL